ncbi:FxsA family protein [Paracoccus hibiscisoli]|uniref:FxsA family protein n=1 Tax=Paracoccus hibiscisoli TaxID=2023261 RepID=A0A4U0QT02_9RHOB|nr:FxsA family protein [Paracoccus hibiscisoli]TJZ85125.1 FxsA family protein [Paracoccus hibiscisoli]
MRLIAMFLVVPIIEIALFIQVGGLIGLWSTLALVLLSAVAGVALMRSQGAQAGREIQRSLSEMRDPSQPMAHGAMIIAAGLLLVVPGFFSDALGLLLLIPGVRRLLMRRIARRVVAGRAGMHAATMRRDPHRPPYDQGVIDGEYVVADDPRAPVDLPPELGDDQPPRRTGGSGWTRH